MNYSAITKCLKTSSSLNKNILNLKIKRVLTRNRKIKLAIRKKEMYLNNEYSLAYKKQYALSKRTLASLAR